MEVIRVDLPIPMCCINGDEPNDPPLETSRYLIPVSAPGPLSVNLILAPMAERLLLNPTSLIAIQLLLACPGFAKRTLLYLSPGTAPPRFSNMSSSPSLSRSANDTPWPFCRWPVPLDELISTKDLPL